MFLHEIYSVCTTFWMYPLTCVQCHNGTRHSTLLFYGRKDIYILTVHQNGSRWLSLCICMYHLGRFWTAMFHPFHLGYSNYFSFFFALFLVMSICFCVDFVFVCFLYESQISYSTLYSTYWPRHPHLWVSESFKFTGPVFVENPSEHWKSGRLQSASNLGPSFCELTALIAQWLTIIDYKASSYRWLIHAVEFDTEWDVKRCLSL